MSHDAPSPLQSQDRAIDHVLEKLRGQGCEPQLRERGWLARCPICRELSLRITSTRDGTVILDCPHQNAFGHRTCTAPKITEALGLVWTTLVVKVGQTSSDSQLTALPPEPQPLPIPPDDERSAQPALECVDSLPLDDLPGLEQPPVPPSDDLDQLPEPATEPTSPQVPESNDSRPAELGIAATPKPIRLHLPAPMPPPLDPELPSHTTSSAIVDDRPAELAQQINRAHQGWLRHFRAGLPFALEAGRLLLEAKSLVRHGEFQVWLAANFAGSCRTARRYMLLAKTATNGPFSLENTETMSQALLRVTEERRVLDADDELGREPVIPFPESESRGKKPRRRRAATGSVLIRAGLGPLWQAWLREVMGATEIPWVTIVCNGLRAWAQEIGLEPLPADPEL